MTERMIAIKGTSFAGSRDIVLKPDPNAPSVDEITTALSDAASQLDIRSEVSERIDDIIERLEAGND